MLGDVAAIVDEKTEQVLPQLGSVALQSGEHAGETIAHRIAGKKTKPFKYRDKGTMATIGRGAAVVQMLGGRTMTGKKAQAAWGVVHLALLPTNEDRAKAVVDWAGIRVHAPARRPDQRGKRVAGVHEAVTVASTTVDLARVQFATTSIYHFLFVPLTLGLAPLVAVMQTIWHRTGNEAWLRLTRFFGTLLLINIAIAVATGLVQEFEFGMNWSVYSRFVGNVFGAPLAIEGLAAFILESTFLGLWIFGWNRLSPRVHLATIWIVAIGAWASGYFILVANSWMQHPVGYKIVNGEAQLTSVWALMSNGFALRAYVHTMLAGLIFGSIVMLGICCWHLLRGHQVDVFLKAAKLALIVAVPVTLLQLVVGNRFGEAVTSAQSMKIAASEAQWNTCQPCGFSAFQIGGFTEDDPTPKFAIVIPRLLSYMATGSFDGQVQGLNQLQKQERAQVRPRQLHAERAGHLLVDAGDGVRRRADVPGRRRRRVALPEAEARAGTLVPVDFDRRDRAPLHRRDRRLDPDRDGTPALDRAGAAADQRGELAQRQHHLARDQPRLLHQPLPHPRHRRLRAHAPLRAPRPVE